MLRTHTGGGESPRDILAKIILVHAASNTRCKITQTRITERANNADSHRQSTVFALN